MGVSEFFNRFSSGYADKSYAESLCEFGDPVFLAKSGGWLLKRAVPGTLEHDAMGVYPFLSCKDWNFLSDDLAQLEREGLLSVAVVTDPFGNFSELVLRKCFPDILIRYKEHFVVDLQRPMNTYVNYHHVRNVRKATRQLSVEHCNSPEVHIDDWISLYRGLVARHSIRGIAKFSPESLRMQLSVPGIVMFRAICKGITVGIILWYINGEVGYYHLAAYSQKGYETNASFALFWSSLEYFSASGLRKLSLGGGAGVFNSDNLDGLSRFKRGWSTETRQAWFCGRIFNRDKYEQISANKTSVCTTYFPAYRIGEHL